MTALWYSIGSVFYGCVLNLFVITSLNSQNTLNFISVCVWGGICLSVLAVPTLYLCCGKSRCEYKMHATCFPGAWFYDGARWAAEKKAKWEKIRMPGERPSGQGLLLCDAYVRNRHGRGSKG